MRKVVWISLLLLSCGVEQPPSIDIQGHRGARGLVPENSIEGFLLAAELGVITLELDLVVSADKQLVVSHEPYFSPDFCLLPAGDAIPEDSVVNIYNLDYTQIQTFDCGQKDYQRFPEQQKMATYKPLLSAVIDSIENYTSKTGRAPLFYNIELKTTETTDRIFHPHPSEFSDLVYDLITKKGIWDRVNIQSFDFRTLQYFHEKYPQVKLAVLIEEEKDWESNLEKLGFTPEIYSSYYPLLSREIIQELHEEGMQVIPWTINETEDMIKLIDWGVDGIITDYPDRALKLTNNYE